MRKLISGIFIVASLFIITSCTQIVDSGEGEVSIGLPFIDGGSNTQRAAAGEEDITSSLTFYFTLTHANGDVISKSGKSGETIQLEFKPGEITAEAIAVSTKIEDEIAKLEKQDFATVLDYVKKSGKAYFTGSGKATVVSKQTVDLNITLKNIAGDVVVTAATLKFTLNATYTEGTNTRAITDAIPYKSGTVVFKATPVSGEVFPTETKFIWRINGIEVKGENKETLSFVPATTAYSLNYEAENSVMCEVVVGEIRQSFNAKFVLVRKLFDDPGIILWNGSSCSNSNAEKVYDLSSMNTSSLSEVTNGMQTFDSISENQALNSSFLSGLSDNYWINCFCIDPKTGDIYLTVEYYNSEKKCHFCDIYRYDSTAEGEKATKLASEISFIPTSMAYLNGKLCMLKVKLNESYAENPENIGEYYTSSISIFSTKEAYLMDASVINQNAFKIHYSHKVLAIASDGESIYTIDSDVANFSVVKVNLDAAFDNSVYKSYISADFMTWNKITNPSNSIKGYLKYGDVLMQSTNEYSYCKVTDLVVNGDSLYVLFNESHINDSLQNCRGGVLRLSKETMGERLPFANGSYVLGWYEGQTTTDEVTIYNPLNALNYSGDLVLKTDVFYRPTRFVALKPDVLVIADESALIKDYNYYNTNRIVTVNLGTGTLSGVNVKAVLESKCSGCGFANY